MRETKFRGKSTLTIDYLDMIGVEHDEGWLFGNLITNNDRPYIVGSIVEVTIDYMLHEFWTEVEQASVGQYTGLKDRNGREVYEGDLVEYTRIAYADCGRTEIEDIEEPIIGEIYYAEGLWLGVRFIDGTGKLFFPGQVYSEEDNLEIKVIGNIHKNPELI